MFRRNSALDSSNEQYSSNELGTYDASSCDDEVLSGELSGAILEVEMAPIELFNTSDDVRKGIESLFNGNWRVTGI